MQEMFAGIILVTHAKCPPSFRLNSVGWDKTNPLCAVLAFAGLHCTTASATIDGSWNNTAKLCIYQWSGEFCTVFVKHQHLELDSGFVSWVLPLLLTGQLIISLGNCSESLSRLRYCTTENDPHLFTCGRQINPKKTPALY